MRRLVLNHLLVFLAVLSFLQPAWSGVLQVTEGFDDITTLPGSGWVMRNQSEPIGLTNWFQGNDSVFPAQSGGPTSYIGANFNNTAGVGTISTWLITPPLDLAEDSVLVF